jgi:membrane peptidoglycan carboxypeptidase
VIGNGHHNGNGRTRGVWSGDGDSRYFVSVETHSIPVARARARARRRHFSTYVARTSRARRVEQSRLVARAAWISTIILGLVIVAALASTVSAAATYYQSEQPVLASLHRRIAAEDSVRVYDSTGTLLFQFNDAGAQHSIPLAKIPVVVINATTSTEDRDFWTNQGVDFQAIARAALADASAGRIQEGGSTITQQLIKQNVLNSDPTFTRKIEEAILSLGMTSQGTFSKSQIIEMYLNSIPYGPTAYGIDAAATAYFSYQDDPATGEMAAQHLDLAQASLLAGIPQSPAVNDPLAGPDGLQHALARQQIVLGNMVAQGYITSQQASVAMAEARSPNFFHPQVYQTDLAPHFVNYIKDQLDQMVTTGQLHDVSRTGLNVYTTLNLDMQNHVQQAMIAHLCGTDLNDYPGSPYRLIRDDNVTNAAAMIADHHNGNIEVMLGSVDYYGKLNCHTNVDGQFNVATQGFRQPGSSFKPIVYSAAFEKGWFPAMTLGNEPTVFWDAGGGKVYKPLNADGNHLTPSMTVRDALQLSQNIPAVKAMQFVGISDAQQQAERMGITQWDGAWGLSSVLGTLNVPLIEMVQAYTVFANYGQYIPLHGINQITDAFGNVLYSYQQPKPVQVMSPQVAFLITSILSDNQARAPEFGKCSVLYLDPSTGDCYYYQGNSPNAWPAAAKTGTQQNLTDDWAMGYTMDYTMGVWVGNNNYTDMNWVDGVTGAAPIFYHSMLYAEHNLPRRAFPVPAGVHRATYSTNGVTTTDWFINGEAPPPNLGNMTPASCITYHPNSNTDPWDYCGLTPAPTPTKQPGG